MPESFGDDGDIDSACRSGEAVFDVDVVRPIQRRNGLPHRAVEAKTVQRASLGRRDLVSADDEAARRVLRVDPAPAGS